MGKSTSRRATRASGLVLTLATLTPLSLVVLAATPGCGARSPLDDTPWDAGLEATVDAPVEAAPELDAAVEAAADAQPPGLVACGQCLIGQCQQPVVACIQEPACQQAVQCIATSCLAGGSLDLGCIANCGKGNPQGALAALSIFQCVTQTCGEDCTTVIGGLLGGLGGLGGGGGRRDAGAPDANR